MFAQHQPVIAAWTQAHAVNLAEVCRFRDYKACRTPKVRRKMAERYIFATIERLGTTERLWDTWCHYVATEGKRRTVYRDAEHVSALHCETLGLVA